MKAALIDEVLARTAGCEDENPLQTDIEGLILLRSNSARHPSHIVFKPALCLVVQGTKWTTFGDELFEYGEGQALVVGVEMPGVSQVMAASSDRPYCGVVIGLDAGTMSEVLETLDLPLNAMSKSARGAFVADCEGPLMDCALRAVRLLDKPQAIPLLYPGIMKEICYWLLTGPHGDKVAAMTIGNLHTHGIVCAIHALRERFAETMRVEQLAEIAGLSLSTFHRQFKAVTSVSPLQYQKQFRLLEARRLLISSGMNVELAAFEVGYGSPSQFSRDYARMFGVPPRRDIVSMRRAAA